ncbi:nuclear transport factor 2 family protein [Enemella sp. A6]|uniref:nuclear transport factor 2 family protein n=1 Tax=Enemella sp. A6 TaxID=3440152 RepID=UPI003EBCB246
MNDGPLYDTELRRLLAEREISRVLARYVRGVDRVDLPLVASCYHVDATDLHGTFEGNVEEFITWLGKLLRRYTMTMHHLGHSLVDWGDAEDEARVETYGVSVHRSPGDDPSGSLLIGFRYLDLFRRKPVDGVPQWRIQRRVCTTEWIRTDDADGRFPIGERFLQGSRDGTDLVQQPWEALFDEHAR